MKYITIQDFMVTDLGLKSNDLILYALIYGFSQDEESDFHGSYKYIKERTGITTDQSVTNIINRLLDNNLIEKVEFKDSKNRTRCQYRANLDIVTTLKNREVTTLKNREVTTLKNREVLYIDNKDIKYIVEFLNSTAHTSFKSSSKNTKQLIHARLAEGYDVDDFKHVITVKCKDWLGTDMSIYLRPSTLFGSKFESYLNQSLDNSIPVKNKCESIMDGVEEKYDW